MIYTLVAPHTLSCGNKEVGAVLVLARTQGWCTDYNPNLWEIMQPGLFRASSQLRQEGLGLYFQHHCFELEIRFKRQHRKALIAWLDSLGRLGRQNIRHLNFTIDLDWDLLMRGPDEKLSNYLEMMDEIHARLSDQVTVTYTATNDMSADMLWSVGDHFLSQKSPKAPRLSVGETIIESEKEYPAKYHAWKALSAYVVHENRIARAVFEPGMSWFGAHD